jgi:hypothetical protein
VSDQSSLQAKRQRNRRGILGFAKNTLLFQLVKSARQ